MVVADESKYGIPPSNPKTTFGVGTEYATALVIPSFCISQLRRFAIPGHPQGPLTKVSRSVLTASELKFPPAITFAQSAVELPTSSRTFRAAWEMVWEAGLPDTLDATARCCWKASAILKMCEG
jgi:hypothetical protein